MSTGSKDIIFYWFARIEAHPELAERLPDSFAVIVQDAAEKQGWSFHCGTLPPRLEEGVEDVQVKVYLGAQSLREIASGALNPQLAYRDGRLRVVGDHAAALTLSEVFVPREGIE